MVDINLLPDELRGREAAERKRLSKTPKVVDFPLSQPLSADAPKLVHGGSGMGRPVVPKPPPLPPPEPQRAAPPLPPLPKRPERLEISRSVVVAGAGKPVVVPVGAAVPSPAAKPPVTPSAYHLDAREAATLALAVKREVASVQRRQTPALPASGRAKRHGWSLWQWVAHLFARPAKPKTIPVARPTVPSPVPPPPVPPVQRPAVPVVIKPAPPRLPQPKLPRPRQSFWKWLRSRFAAKRPTLGVKPPLLKPAPVPPRPVPAPAVQVMVKPEAPTALPKPRRLSWWQRLLAWWHRRHTKPVKLPTLPLPKVPPPAPPSPPVPAPLPPPPRPVSAPAVPVMVKPAALKASVKPRRPSWWQRLLAWFFRRHQKPTLPHVVSRLPAPLPPPPRPPVPVPTPPPVNVVAPVPQLPPRSVPLPTHVPVAPPPRVPPPSPPPAPPKPVTPPAPKRPGEHPAGRPFKTLAINLIPEEFVRHPELNLSRKFLIYLSSLGVACFALLTVSQFISWYQYLIGNEIRDTEQRITLLQTQIDNYQERLDAARRLEGDLGTMEQLLSRHRYWTQIFAALERHTVDEVYFASFTSTGDGGLEFSAHGRDYGSVARQLVAFREATDAFSAVKITGASAIIDRETKKILQVNFGVSLSLTPEAFTLPLTSPP